MSSCVTLVVTLGTHLNVNLKPQVYIYPDREFSTANDLAALLFFSNPSPKPQP